MSVVKARRQVRLLRTHPMPGARTCTGGTALEPPRSEHLGPKRDL